MSLSSLLCGLIKEYCKEGKYKRVPQGDEKSYKLLAKEAGVPVTTIQNWINSGVEPTLGKAEAVFKAMGYSLRVVIESD